MLSLFCSSKELVKTERKITRQVLEHILEAEDRKVHLELGYSSLFEWLMKDLGYSESAASRRISSARLLRTVPEAAQKLESGEVNLTTLAQAKAAMRTHTKVTGEKLSAQEQAEVIEEISNKTSQEVQSTLFERFPETASTVHQERQVALNEEFTRIMFNLNKEAMADLRWVKDFLSHSIPDRENAKVFAKLLREFRKREEAKGDRAMAKAASVTEEGRANSSAWAKSNAGTNSKTEANSNAGARRVTLHRVQRKCEYRDPQTGRVCGSSFMVEVDHIHPRALGGEDHSDNYRCLCRAHNQFVAEQKLGEIYRNARRRRV